MKYTSWGENQITVCIPCSCNKWIFTLM